MTKYIMGFLMTMLGSSIIHFIANVESIFSIKFLIIFIAMTFISFGGYFVWKDILDEEK